MIKKLLLSASALFLMNVSSFAQVCTPNVSCVPVGQTYGVCPDSATGLAVGVVGVPYNQVVSMMVPPDGADFGFPTATIVSIEVTSVDSLAPGLSYQCFPANCTFPGSSNGCFLISGTPTQVWNKKIIVNAIAHATIFTAPVDMPQTNEQYRSVVVAATSITDLDLTKFDVRQNAPNPFSEKSEIYFSSLSTSEVEFKVYNMVGAVVFADKFEAQKGSNIIKIDANSFAPGVYIYSVKNGEQTITKRMVVTSK